MLIASITFIMPGPMIAATATGQQYARKGEHHVQAAHDEAPGDPAGEPATSPRTRPMSELTTIGATAVGIEIRPPQMIRLRMSRP